MSTPDRTRRDALRQALSLACLGAGAIHLALGPDHLQEWAPLGVGFYAAGALQVVWGARLWRREARTWLAAGAAGSALFVLTWLVSRTTGLPLAPDGAEQVGRADLLCVVLESVVAVGALTLLRRPAAGRTRVRRARTVLAGTTVVVLGLTGAALAAPVHQHGAAHSCPARPVASGVDANHDGADDGVQAYFRCQLHAAHEGHATP